MIRRIGKRTLMKPFVSQQCCWLPRLRRPLTTHGGGLWILIHRIPPALPSPSVQISRCTVRRSRAPLL